MFDLSISPKFNSKNFLEILIKNISKKELFTFKVCFSLIYSIKSIQGAKIHKQTGRYYELYLNEKNEIIETGDILFANLKLSGQDNSLFYFDNKGSEGHYDKNGKSVKKALMKTPINGARLSSPFGMRNTQ